MSIRITWTQVKDTLLSIVFPPICVGCDSYLNQSDSLLCNACISHIQTNTALLCPICKTRLSSNKRICNHSTSDRIRFPYLLGAATHYDNEMIKHIIHLCKYQKIHSLTTLCANVLIEYVDQLNPQPSILELNPLVIPIPLHPRKERERGFNQSALIAQKFAQQKNLSYSEALVKTRYDDPQAKTKTHEERFTRMQNVFVLPDPKSVQNKNIILIDDVSTSGATLSETAQVLKSAGAKQILALVIAKA